MQLTNTTNIPNGLVRELVRFAKPVGVSNFDVMLKKSARGGVRGRAYTKGSSYHYSARPFIVVAVGNATYPSKRKAFGAYLPVLSLDECEAVLHVLAHELRHLWQAKHAKGWRVWGAKGQFSERDADAYALRKVRQWRKIKGVQ